MPVFLARVSLAPPARHAHAETIAISRSRSRRRSSNARSAFGIAVDSRIERGRTYRHALRIRRSTRERYDRIVVAAAAPGQPRVQPRRHRLAARQRARRDRRPAARQGRATRHSASATISTAAATRQSRTRRRGPRLGTALPQPRSIGIQRRAGPVTALHARLGARRHLRVDRDGFLGDRRPGEVRDGPPATGPSHLGGELGVGDQGVDTVGERSRERSRVDWVDRARGLLRAPPGSPSQGR